MKQTVHTCSVKQDAGRTMTCREVLLIGLLSLVWGGSFFFVGVAVRELPPFTIVFFRVALAACLLSLFMACKGIAMPRSATLWGSFVVMGVLNNVIPFSLIVWGQTHIASGLASILNATTPLFSIVLAHVVSKDEQLTYGRAVGGGIGWLGVLLLIGVDSLQEGGSVAGQCAVLGGACSYACAAIYGRRFKGLSPLTVTTGMLCASALMMAPVAALVDTPWVYTISGSTILALTGLATLSTALAYLIYFRVLATAGATNLLLVTFLIPVSAIMLGALFLNEHLHWNAFAGMGVICVGLLVIDGRLVQRAVKTP